jgi:hypothetical protein
MTQDVFYQAVSTASFTLLGLWLVVVQARREWRFDADRRRMAYIVSMHFLLPGAMSILALAVPDQAIVWRASFAAAGAIGVVGVVLIGRTLREDHDSPRIVRWLQLVVLPVYVVITGLAIAPGLPAAIGLTLTALQVEALVLSLLLIFGVQTAWFLLMEPTREEQRMHDAGQGLDDPT